MTISREKYLLHLKSEEKITLLRKLMDTIEISIYSGIPQFSDFLDPYEIRLAESVANGEMVYSETSQLLNENFERNIIGFSTETKNLDLGNHLKCFKIESKFSDLQHNKILGSILGLGLERRKIGDISIHRKIAYILVKSEIADFIYFHLKKIGREGVRLEEVPIQNFESEKPQWEIQSSTVKTMRLDSIVSTITKLPRSKAKKMIEQNLVKVNFEPIMTPHMEIGGCLLSIRGYGRFKIFEEFHETKKGRIHFTYGKKK